MTQNITLDYFKPEEFINDGKYWFSLMSPELRIKLDLIREYTGVAIHVSKAKGAVGRNLGVHNKSKHNVDHWGCVYAIDVFPELTDQVDADTFFRCAAGAVGFRGVGYYPQWEMGTLKGGFHLDVRPDRTMDDPAEWGYVNGEFVSADEALEWGK